MTERKKGVIDIKEFLAKESHFKSVMSDSTDRDVLKGEAVKLLADYLEERGITFDDAKKKGFLTEVRKWIDRKLIENQAAADLDDDEDDKPATTPVKRKSRRSRRRERKKEEGDDSEPVVSSDKTEGGSGEEKSNGELLEELEGLVEDLQKELGSKLGDILKTIKDLEKLLKFTKGKDTVPASVSNEIDSLVGQLDTDAILLRMIKEGVDSHYSLVKDIINIFIKIVKKKDNTEDDEDTEQESLEWPEDPRPEERMSWTPWDYIYEAMSQIKPPGVATLKDSVDLRGEFHQLVRSHPVYSKDESYWRTALASWNMLYIGDPRSGGSDFTVDFNAWKEKDPQTVGYDVEKIKEVLGHKEYGRVAMRIVALIEIMQADPEFEYPEFDYKGETIGVKKGQFLARNMDKNADNLRKVVNGIVEREGWLADFDIPDHAHLVDVVFNIVNSLDMRGHFFLDDTAAATTKGFGGEDYTWASRPEATINYDIDRYNREAKASWYLLAGVDIPSEWHERVAINLVIKTNPLRVNKDPRPSETAGGPEQESYFDLLLKTDPRFSGATNDEQVRIGLEYAKNVVAKELIDNERRKIHDLRHWFHILMSEKDRRKCMEYAVGKTKVSKHETPFVRKDYGLYEFRDRGPTFPTVYQFYMEQMSAARPENDRVASSSLDRVSIFADDFDYSVFDVKEGGIRGFAMYQVAYGGWVTALDMIKTAPKTVDGDTLLKNIDKFLGAIGKAKIVDGAHHNMMNTLAYLFLVKQFKFLEPRNHTEFRRIRKLALNKILGGGIPSHVKNYMSWILGEAKSEDSVRFDRPGDILRPMDPSFSETIEETVHHATKGLEDEPGYTRGWTKFWATVEGAMTGLSHTEDSKTKPIPLGDIEWDNQDTSTKIEK